MLSSLFQLWSKIVKLMRRQLVRKILIYMRTDQPSCHKSQWDLKMVQRVKEHILFVYSIGLFGLYCQIKFYTAV